MAEITVWHQLQTDRQTAFQLYIVDIFNNARKLVEIHNYKRVWMTNNPFYCLLEVHNIYSYICSIIVCAYMHTNSKLTCFYRGQWFWQSEDGSTMVSTDGWCIDDYNVTTTILTVTKADLCVWHISDTLLHTYIHNIPVVCAMLISSSVVRLLNVHCYNTITGPTFMQQTSCA